VKKTYIISIILISALVFSGCIKNKSKTTSTPTPVPSKAAPTKKPMTKTLSKPTMTIDAEKTYSAVIKTNMGNISVKLFADKSPITVNNFVYLAKEKFYDNVVFHRIIKDFMIQGGDPLGTGTGGPGYSFEDEFNDEKLVKGSLAMANSGPDTNGSQFFIVTKDSTPWLDGKHTNFGIVTDGIDIVDKIEAIETGFGDRPVKEVIINSVEIIEE
jgi:cyclophilin family peptidyl-prolyl cis-trans isomerase